jgi:SAM-dependent methyltransferase
MSTIEASGANTRFGEQRLVRPDLGSAARLLYRLMGVADPSHYLRSRYVRRALAAFAPGAPTRILDAGCGRGDYAIYLARRYPRADVLAVDIDAVGVERARDAARRLGIQNLRFAIADLITLELRADFDLVISVDVLEHIRSQQTVLETLARSLRPGGTAIYHVPTVRPRPVLLSRYLGGLRAWAEEEHEADELTAEEFSARVAASGLSLLHRVPTFGRYTGELANSLFALPFADTPRNRVLQAVIAPPCRLLALADLAGLDRPRYAVLVVAEQRADSRTRGG